MPTPEGEARMSAVTVEVAEPLLKQRGKTPERGKAVITLVVAGGQRLGVDAEQMTRERRTQDSEDTSASADLASVGFLQ